MDQDDPTTYAELAGFDGDWRDGWHNEDFLALMARRWRLDQVERALDVGCGVGHWGQRLAPYLSQGAELVGIDSQPAFLEQAQARARAKGLADRSRWLAGDALALPFDDDSFDLVTCQTVLMHVRDPLAVLQEMVRVTRPGGLVAVTEPHNLLSAMAELSEDADLDTDELMALLTFELTVQRGKRALGQGDSSIALRLPGLLEAAGLTHLASYQSDTCALARPPYSSKAQQDIEQRLDWVESEAMVGGTRADARERFVAGGGSVDAFEDLWRRHRAHDLRIAAAMRAGTWTTTGAFTMLLVSGRVPSA